jgi:exopolyphosphatase
VPILAIPRAELSLRPELLHLFEQTGINSEDVCTLEDISALDPSQTGLFLVDHNFPRGKVGELFNFKNHPERKEGVEGIIDHHVDEQQFSLVSTKMKRYDIRTSGSCASLVTQWIMGNRSAQEFSPNATDGPTLLRENIAETRGIAQLLLSAILIDTSNLSSKVTPVDPIACHFLAEFLPELVMDQFYRDMKTAKISIEGMSFTDLLRRDYKEYDTPSGKLGMSTIIRPVAFLHSHYGDMFEREISEFVTEQKLKVHITMTVAGEGSGFKRGGMVITDDKQLLEEIKSKGSETYDFLEVGDIAGCFEDTALICWVYNQGDLSASRKQVAPMVIEVMQG